MNIQKNFLLRTQYEKILNYFKSNKTPWYYFDKMVPEEFDKKDRGYFGHVIHHDNQVLSEAFNLMHPILEKLDVAAIVNIRANLNINSNEVYYSPWHEDWGFENQKTSIYYLNTNNGYTELDLGTKKRIPSEANSLVTFDAKTKHRLVSQTDETSRYVININYFTK